MDWKDRVLSAAYWLFWAALATLATQQAIYLARGYGQWEWALAIGLTIAGAKLWCTLAGQNAIDEERRISLVLIKRLLLRSGPVSGSIHRIDNPDADPAFTVIVDETIGLKEYEAGLVSAEMDWRIGQPPEIAVQLPMWSQMNAIDRKLVKVAKRIGNADHNYLLHDIRVIIMREIYKRVDLTASDPFATALNEILSEVPRLSPIYRLLNATRAEYLGEDSGGIRIGSWQIVESWLKAVPPTGFDDICGGEGRSLPPIPAALQSALKSEPPGTTYFS